MISSLLRLRTFDIEASSRCNLRCRFCPRETMKDTGLMSEETFARLLETVAPGRTDTFSFVGIGEPLLNPLLPRFVTRLKQESKGRAWVTTNATLLTAERAGALFAAGLDTLDISFNGTDAQAYEDLVPGGHFERTLGNVDGAVRLARAAKTQVQINFILTRENAGREAEIKDFWRRRGIEYFRVQHLHNRAGSLRTEGLESVDAPGLRARSCQVFDLFHFVTFKGDFLYCCHDLVRERVLGNVHAHSWEEIARRKREIGRARSWPEFCQSCTDPQRHHLSELLDRSVWAAARRRLATTFGAGSEKPSAL